MGFARDYTCKGLAIRGASVRSSFHESASVALRLAIRLPIFGARLDTCDDAVRACRLKGVKRNRKIRKRGRILLSN